jgi:uncharacterized protein YeeX (DUF496 family)
MNTTIILYALRYAMGRQNQELPNVSKFIQANMHDISCGDLQEILEELKAYYSEHTDDKHYLEATILSVAIKRELYGE